MIISKIHIFINKSLLSSIYNIKKNILLIKNVYFFLANYSLLLQSIYIYKIFNYKNNKTIN
jgi:hypothetical protein